MNTHITTRSLELSFCGSKFTLPAGTLCHLVKGADGLKGDLYAVSQAKVIMDLTGNKHDPIYRYCWVPADAVIPVRQ